MLSVRPLHSERNRIDMYQPRRTHLQPDTRRSPKSTPLSVAAKESRHAAALLRNNRNSEPIPPGWDVPHLTKTPWEAERNKKRVEYTTKRASWRRSTRVEYQFPAHFFKILPREVYDCILAQLEHIHLGGDQPCSDCYLADLANLSLVSREWDKATTSPMYRKILLTTNDEHTKVPKLNVTGTSRLKLLRRTLRECNAMARYVRELHLADFQTLFKNASIEREEIVNLVASLVMACPFLERLVGFNIPYTHDFDRLSHALSTRPNLRERVWLLSEKEPELSDEEETDCDHYYLASRDPVECFLELNAKHPLLTSLVLHQSGYQALKSLNFRSIVGTLRQLPALRHLSISGLAATSFTNMALTALPSNLQSLRLENLPGVNDKGLQRLAKSAMSGSLVTLTLINLDIRSLDTISLILSEKFSNLKMFSIAQQKPPRQFSQNAECSFYGPSISKIHWEFSSESGPLPSLASSEESLDNSDELTFPFVSSEPICCLATSILATSIQNGHFPSLQSIRIPHDPQGVIQALCRPLASALLPSDAANFMSDGRSPTSYMPLIQPYSHHAASDMEKAPYAQSQSAHRADSAIESPKSSINLPCTMLTPSRSRIAAQGRILAARKQPAMMVRVFDSSGTLLLDKPIRGHIGDVRSKITYDLKADRGHVVGTTCDDVSEQNEWITGMDDLVGNWESDSTSGWMRRRCGHPYGRRAGRNVVQVEDIF